MSTLRFLIVDSYPKASREEFDVAGIRQGWRLYAEMLARHLPDAECCPWFAADSAQPPGSPAEYKGILWTGSDLTVYRRDDPRVSRMIEFAKAVYQAGTPAFGTCWGLQIAVTAAGGEVRANPRGREIGIGRKIRTTAEGRRHPMMEGKPPVFDSFSSHLDEVTQLPEGAVLLASNDFSAVQGAEVKHANGVFWATQYHLEYDLPHIAGLIRVRAPKLLREGFFRTPEDLTAYAENLRALDRDPCRKDLRWQLDIADDVLCENVRALEFHNWIRNFVLPRATGD